MKVAIIVAMSTNRIIGHENKLPWHIPEDLKYFKRVTMGKPVIMGRKTYESIGRPLPGRDNIVVTRNPSWHPEGVKVAHDVDEAIRMGLASAELSGMKEVMVIGGAEIYAQALPRTDRLYMTQVQAWIEGDALFPEIEWHDWDEVSREDLEAEDPNPFDYSFICYDRLLQ